MARFFSAIAFAGAVAIASSSLASEALVEEASSASGLSAFQFLDKGTRLTLSDTDRIVIGYPETCVRETIRGGIVTIGTGQSEITGGEVDRETFSCGARVALSTAERQESGASAWRAVQDGDAVVIYDLSPLIIFSHSPSMVKIERIDLTGRPLLLRVAGTALDLAEKGVALEPGGIYVVSTEVGSIEIELDFDAVSKGGPAVTRVVRF